MRGYAQVQLIGNLVADPEERWAGLRDNERQKLAAFRLAVSQGKEPTAYMDCEAWGKWGELILQYTGKGTPLFVSGKLKCDRWEKNGKMNTRWKVVVLEARMLAARPARQQADYSDSPGSCRQGQAPVALPQEEDEDIPF